MVTQSVETVVNRRVELARMDVDEDTKTEDQAPAQQPNEKRDEDEKEVPH